MSLLVQAIIMIIVLFLVLFVPSIQAQWAISCHSFVSSFLQKLESEPIWLKIIEPITVPEINTTTFMMKNVNFQGLKSLHIEGSCLVMKDENIINLDFGIGLKNVTYEGEYSFKVLLLWISGKVKGTIGHISAEMGVYFNETSREPKLSTFRIRTLDDLQVTQINGGSWVFNWAFKGIAGHIAQSSREAIIENVENKTRNFTVWLFSTLTIPIMLMDAVGNVVNALP